MSNLESLKPFKKGDDSRRNINGRPKGAKSLITKLREALDRIHEGTQTRYDELLVKSIVNDAIKEDGQSRRLVLQYLEGMPKESHDITTLGEGLNTYSNEQIERIARRILADNSKSATKSD